MRTFLQYINEKEHQTKGYSDWGILHPKTGKIISGSKHRNAINHNELKAAVGGKKAHEFKDAVEWAHVISNHPAWDETTHKEPRHLMLRKVTPQNKHHVLNNWQDLQNMWGNVRVNNHEVEHEKRANQRVREMGVNESLIVEKQHSECGYDDWGIIHPKGHIVSGQDHPHCTAHTPLKAHLLQKEKKGKVSTNQEYDSMMNAPEWAHHPEVTTGKGFPGHLMLRRVNKENKHHVLKNWNDLHHDASEQVSLNHGSLMHKKAAYNKIRMIGEPSDHQA